MNRGIFNHIVVSVIYVFLVMYILQDNDTNIEMRALIIAGLIATNIFCAMINGANEFYEKKI